AQLRVSIGHLEIESADRTSPMETGCLKQLAIAMQERKEPLDGCRGSLVSRGEDHRFKHLLVFLQHSDEQIFFRRKEIIKAAAVRPGTLEDLGNSRRRVTLLKKELPGRLNNFFPRFRFWVY